MQVRIPVTYEVEYVLATRGAPADGDAGLFTTSHETRTKSERAEWMTLTIPEASIFEAPVTLSYRWTADGRLTAETVEVLFKDGSFYRPLTRQTEKPYLDGYVTQGTRARHVDLSSAEGPGDLSFVANKGDHKNYDVLSRMADDGGPAIPALATDVETGRDAVVERFEALEKSLLVVFGKVYEKCGEPRIAVQLKDARGPAIGDNLRITVSYDRAGYSTPVGCFFHFDEGRNFDAFLRALRWDFNNDVPVFHVEDAVAYRRADAGDFLSRTAYQACRDTQEKSDYLPRGRARRTFRKAWKAFAAAIEPFPAHYSGQWRPEAVAEAVVAWGKFNDAWANAAACFDRKRDIGHLAAFGQRSWRLAVSRAHQAAAFDRWSKRYEDEFHAVTFELPDEERKRGFFASWLRRADPNSGLPKRPRC